MNYRDLINVYNPEFKPLAYIEVGKSTIYVYKVYWEKETLKAICSIGMNGVKEIQDILTMDNVDYLCISNINDTSTYVSLKDINLVSESVFSNIENEYQI